MKKIVAKEFLILLSVVFISLISFPITYGYNVYLSKEKEVLEDSIQNTPILWEKNYSALHYSYNNKFGTQRRVFINASKFYNNVGYGRKYSSSYSLWNLLQSSKENTTDDELYVRFKDFILFHNKQWITDIEDMIPNNGIGFKRFIENNLITEEDNKNNDLGYKNEAYRNDIQNRIHLYIEKMLNKKEQIKIALNTFYILFTIAFILRFLLISIRWSIKELKS